MEFRRRDGGAQLLKSERRKVGVLLVQLGTPDQPTPRAVRRYLREFLGDPRVIEAPRLLWWFILRVRVLPFRSYQSAQKYRRIWDPERGSPLLYYTRRQALKLQDVLGDDYLVRFGMRYGNPSVRSAITELLAACVDRFLVFPLYPQYSATTTGTAYDAVFRDLITRRFVPAIRVVPPYYDHPLYLEAVARLVEETVEKWGQKPERILFSYHGIPVAYAERGDPYPTHVKETTRQLVARLGLNDDEWILCYQSRFGRAPWLQPYTEDVLVDLARRGVRRVLVVQPGFTADCLETIDEIGFEAAELFRAHGGEELVRVPCLNDHPLWIEAMAAITRGECCNWVGDGEVDPMPLASRPQTCSHAAEGLQKDG